MQQVRSPKMRNQTKRMPKTGDKNASSLSTVQRQSMIEPRMCTAMPRPLHLLSSRRGPHTEHPAELLEPEIDASHSSWDRNAQLECFAPTHGPGSPTIKPTDHRTKQRAAPSVVQLANLPTQRVVERTPLALAIYQWRPVDSTGRRANALAASLPSDRRSGYPGGTHPLLFAAAVAPLTQPRGSRSQTHQQPPTAVFVNQSARPIGSPNNNASASHRLKLAR
jgi:hypothetical protein